jgi:hypothetical protein
MVTYRTNQVHVAAELAPRWLGLIVIFLGQAAALAEDATTEPASRKDPPKLPPPAGAQRLSPDYDAWIDPQRGVVLVDGQVALRQGMLEMFACIRNTKEHESIVSANTAAFLVHAALIRLGAEPGTPVQFVPEYKPPTGTQIDVSVEWQDAEGKTQTARAQEWIRNAHSRQEMKQPWVFAGSYFWKDKETGREYYQAEGGDFVCVSNFSTALLDIPIESSPSDEDLMFEAFTERIPPRGTPVRIVLKPVKD